MKICKRGLDWLQVINVDGDVRLCSWMNNNVIGNLITDNVIDILHGEKANQVRKTLIDETYMNCSTDNCPYLSNGTIEENCIEVEEIPDFPSVLWLAYEGACNYNCTCCTSYNHIKETRENDYNEKYDLIEEKLKKVLPYIKEISANGRGELFASKRTLKLLSEWKPMAPPEQIKVLLETNGSLFNESNWKQIENVGHYNLSVAITIMSFNEQVYRHLSGTKLPIANIENNLHFVKGLREKGIINHLELATVLQEENFREMPEMTKRFIDEFGADQVRIRPIFPGGVYDNNIQWFMDVRNPEHPYYEQYKEIMRDPIFENEKVLLWSADIESALGEHPGIKNQKNIQALEIIAREDFIQFFVERLGEKRKINLYGNGILGRTLIAMNTVSENKVNIVNILDKYSEMKLYMDIPVIKPSELVNKSELVVVAVYNQIDNIKPDLEKMGYIGEIINLYELVEDYIKKNK